MLSIDIVYFDLNHIMFILDSWRSCRVQVKQCLYREDGGMLLLIWTTLLLSHKTSVASQTFLLYGIKLSVAVQSCQQNG